MIPKEKFVDPRVAAELVQKLGQEFAIVKNPVYVHPPFELYPLSNKISQPVAELKAAVMDMDGTTTSTETLCIHSLEYMVRQVSARPAKTDWQGLDKQIDYPNIIGNSTTRHVEYLVNKYKPTFKSDALKHAYFHAAAWFLIYGKDPARVSEVRNNLLNLDCKALLADQDLIKSIDSENLENTLIPNLVQRYGDHLRTASTSDLVRIGIDIYYQRYHHILTLIEKDQRDKLAQVLPDRKDTRLIEPMPGIGEFIALAKGWLGDEAALLKNQLVRFLPDSSRQRPGDPQVTARLNRLSLKFAKNPLKLAVVTSSIFYEAHIVISEVMRVLQTQVRDWPVSEKRKTMITEALSDYHNVYDGFVTASDSSEIRLKPHRDLYSIALHQLGIATGDFDKVVGFEDSESGIIAMRAAGIGLCLAVPFSDTQHHDFRAASHVLHGGLPETIIMHNCFIKL